MKENNTIEKFIEVRRHPALTFENKMARAYRSALGDLESAKRNSELPQIEDAHRRLAEIETDIEDFMDIVEGYSLHGIAEKLNRSKLDIEKAKRKARNILKRAKLENPDLSLDNVVTLEVVQTAYLERDRIIAELKPITAESMEKLNKAEKILAKY